VFVDFEEEYFCFVSRTRAGVSKYEEKQKHILKADRVFETCGIIPSPKHRQTGL